MSWDEVRACLFWLLVLCVIGFGISQCVSFDLERDALRLQCDAWNHRIIECSHDDDPHGCRSALMVEPPAHCSVYDHAAPVVPRWQALEQSEPDECECIE